MMELSVGYVRSVVMYRQGWRGTSFCRLGQKKGISREARPLSPIHFRAESSTKLNREPFKWFSTYLYGEMVCTFRFIQVYSGTEQSW